LVQLLEQKFSLLFSDGITTPPANFISGLTSELALSFLVACSAPLPAGGLFAWWRGLGFWRGADYFAVALPLGHAIGRVGCFFNGCCPGRPPHPVQLYESAGLLAISLTCFFLLKRVQMAKLPSGTSFCVYVFLYGLLRLLLDPLRADGRPERFWGFSYQQGFAIAFMVLAAVLMINRERSTASRFS
jgi:phosphatidylglycerol---prolipoprotein diacylglyceryl transferase